MNRDLSLYNNSISSFQNTIETLQKIKKLKKLDIYGNPICETPAFSEQIITNLTLKSLDGEEVDEDKIVDANDIISELKCILLISKFSYPSFNCPLY